MANLNRSKWLAAVILALTFIASAQAQTVIQDYDQARDEYFWDQLYKDGGETLYCGKPFSSRSGLQVEHVVPASWIAAHFGCLNRNACPVDAYQFASADLHNLWPAVGLINGDRSNLDYGEVTGEGARIRESTCGDFERLGSRSAGIVEPRNVVKGDIARTIFYMELTYGIPIHRIRRMLIKWHENDPVDAEEERRNGVIFRIQRRRNPFIKGDDGKRLEPTPY